MPSSSDFSAPCDSSSSVNGAGTAMNVPKTDRPFSCSPSAVNISSGVYPQASSVAVIAPAEVPSSRSYVWPRRNNSSQAPTSTNPFAPPPSKTRSYFTGRAAFQ
jgi:hypothetical protein